MTNRYYCSECGTELKFNEANALISCDNPDCFRAKGKRSTDFDLSRWLERAKAQISEVDQLFFVIPAEVSMTLKEAMKESSKRSRETEVLSDRDPYILHNTTEEDGKKIERTYCNGALARIVVDGEVKDDFLEQMIEDRRAWLARYAKRGEEDG